MPDIISNTSCLIALDNIGMQFILKELYGNIYISEEVHNEFGSNIEEWIEVKAVRNKNYLHILSNLIDLGEASTIALAVEMKDSSMILDDLKARKVAQNLNLPFTGVLGVILKAKQEEVIHSTKDVLIRLKLANFRISKEMENEVLRLANE